MTDFSHHSPRHRMRWLRTALRVMVKTSLVAALFGVLGYAFSHYMFESERFHVQGIIVEGAVLMEEADIVKAAQITQDDNLLMLDTRAVCGRILALPSVRHCEVRRAYPDKVLIRIEERVAKAILLCQNHAYELDGEGQVIREVQSSAPTLLPLITNVPELGVLESGQRITQPAVLSALNLWDNLAKAGVLNDFTLSEISAEAPDNLRVFFDELTYETRWGRGGLEQQVARFRALWKQTEGQMPCKHYLDLRFDEDVVCG